MHSGEGSCFAYYRLPVVNISSMCYVFVPFKLVKLVSVLICVMIQSLLKVWDS